jgi:putative endonuclease
MLALVRALSSAGERSLHTGEVAGSIPAAPTSLRRFAATAGKPASHSHAKRRRLPVEARRAKTGGDKMKYVYLLQSIEFPDETYVGLTDDLRSRFTAHNAGRSPHTAKYKPWRLVTYVAFSDERKAVAFERYLKSAAGRAFANKRLR